MAGKPRFLVGEVVAWVASGGDGTALAYYQVAGFFYDQENMLRYTFRHTDSTASSLCPVEKCIRKLTAREMGRTRKPPSDVADDYRGLPDVDDRMDKVRVWTSKH